MKYQLLKNGIYGEDGCLTNADTVDVSNINSGSVGKSRSPTDRGSPNSHLLSSPIGGISNAHGDYSLTVRVEEEDWQPIGAEKEYFPATEDVGCVLKVRA